MNDLDDITPPEGIPVPSAEEQARSERAQVRPGTHVRPPEAIDRWKQDMGIDAIIERARDLIRVARNPMSDATWPVIRDWLLFAKDELAERGEPGDQRKYLTVCRLLRGDRHA